MRFEDGVGRGGCPSLSATMCPSEQEEQNKPVPYSDKHIQQKLAEIKAQAHTLPRPPKPKFSPVEPGMDVASAMKRVQAFITALEYNFTGSNHFERRRDRGMLYLSSVVDAIMQDCLPIQCVEAVFLAAILTAGLTKVDRLPLSFKSQADGKTFRHIVLAVHHNGKWGALGLSRRANLMDKELKFNSLADLVWDYEKAYQTCWHRLSAVYVGFPLPHDTRSILPIKWRVLTVNLIMPPSPTTSGMGQDEATRVLDNYARSATWLLEHYYRSGSLPEALHEVLSYEGDFPRRLNSLLKRRASTATRLQSPLTLPPPIGSLMTRDQLPRMGDQAEGAEARTSSLAGGKESIFTANSNPPTTRPKTRSATTKGSS